MTPRWIRPLLICAAWLPATVALATGEPPKVQLKPPAPAPAEAPTPVAPLAVEASTPAVLRTQTYRYVETFAATTEKLDQLARWTAPVCVTVQGLPADAAAQVKARVEEVAKALGLRTLERGCNPNIELMFADRPQPFLDRVAATREDLLGYWHRRDRDTLKTMTRPIQAWYVTSTVGSGQDAGSAFAYVDAGATGVQAPSGIGRQAKGEIIDDPDERSPTGCGDSRFKACLKGVFNHVLVVVDKGAVQGASAGLLADYVTMLALAQPKSLDGCNGLTSVIDLYASACRGREAPNGLTRTDVAYLTSLYKADLEARKAAQMTDVAGRMADMLLKANKMDRLAAQGEGRKTSTGR